MYSAYRDRPSAPQGSNQYTLTTSQCYDPAVPRTGRWTDEELAFRDVLIGQFLGGNLPLGNGVKLNDFLANMVSIPLWDWILGLVGKGLNDVVDPPPAFVNIGECVFSRNQDIL